MPALTVTQINRYISFRLKEDKNIQGILVKGEISNFIEHYRSGHLYFTLKDKESSIKAVMFASAASKLKFSPEDGMAVIVSGNISVYERDGVYQLYVNDIHPAGVGAASVAFEQLKARLAKEGIFDISHKRQIPMMPRKIGVVTSISGAAIRDIINVLSRRYPLCELYIANALVQGETAADSVCRGIIRAESEECDVIIVGRGGGSSEDLSAFNNEKIAYAIYNCKVPVISAVGHETDFTIADLAADMRAPTPSAAAELAVPSIEHLSEKINILSRRAENAMNTIFDKSTDKLIRLNSRLSEYSPEKRIELNQERLNAYSDKIKFAFERFLSEKNADIDKKIGRLEMLSPLKVLSRGYSLVYKKDELVKSADKLLPGDIVKIRLANGEANAEIK